MTAQFCALPIAGESTCNPIHNTVDHEYQPINRHGYASADPGVQAFGALVAGHGMDSPIAAAARTMARRVAA